MRFLLLQSNGHGGFSVISPYTFVAATGSIFHAFENTSFFYAMIVSFLCCTYVVIGAVNEPDARSFPESLSVAG